MRAFIPSHRPATSRCPTSSACAGTTPAHPCIACVLSPSAPTPTPTGRRSVAGLARWRRRRPTSRTGSSPAFRIARHGMDRARWSRLGRRARTPASQADASVDARHARRADRRRGRVNSRAVDEPCPVRLLSGAVFAPVDAPGGVLRLHRVQLRVIGLQDGADFVLADDRPRTSRLSRPPSLWALAA